MQSFRELSCASCPGDSDELGRVQFGSEDPGLKDIGGVKVEMEEDGRSWDY